MNKKQIFISICLFIVFFSLLSVASASDTSANVTVTAVSDDSNTISVTNNQDHTLGADPGTFTDLNTTISGSQAGQTVTLGDDYTYTDSDGDFSEGIIITKSITIDGQGHTINAVNNASIFNIGANCNVILKNINFVNAHGENGGAIKLDSSTHLEIINCNFINNTATTSGGAIFVVNSSSLTSNLVINGSNFINNSASFGGAVYLNGKSNEFSIIEDSTFIDCTSSGDGGAAYISANNVALKNVVFANNVVGDDGGAIYWEGYNGIIENITCTNNRGISASKNDGSTSSTRGGTICLTGGNMSISDSKFISSSAFMDVGKDSSKVDGGALFVTGNGVNITNVEFINCNATNNGGALYVIGNDTQILNCTFASNTGLDAGALYVEGDGCKLVNSTFKDNVAGDDGGAIYWEGDNGIIYNMTCINNKGISATKPDGVNTSSTRGGTISIIGSNITLSKSSFKSSKAYIDAGKDSSKVDGGAIFITGNGIIINETEFDDCTAVNNGGAIYIIGNNTQILNCSIDNTKAYIGGAIFIAGDDTIVDNSLFRHNTASGNSPTTGELGGSGGAIYVEGEDATISNSDFAYGDAVNYGGAISVWGANANITKNVFDNCTTTYYDGGSIYVNGVNATISLSNFTRSTAKNNFAHGGAIQVSGDGTNILDCNFDSCFAYYGGVIHISGSQAVVNGSNFKHSVEYNKIYPYDGGAIYVSGTYATISNSNFTDFTAEGRGGVICIEGANTLINSSNFDNCKAANGGVIYVFGNYAQIEDSTFKLSTAADFGGAIYLTAWGASIKGSNITDCEASKSGGAIYVAGGGTIIAKSDFENCLAKGSSSSYGGGAIYIEGPDTHISTSNFNKNNVNAKAYGGTIYINGERTIIDTSVFNSSSAKQGGIIYIQGEQAIIRSSIFANSSSSSEGGAIAVYGHNATIDESDFDNIWATNNGGAIYVKGEDTDILHSSFNDCVSKGAYSGGAIYINDKDTTVAYSNFTSCEAKVAGAIYINGINTLISYCNLDNNTALGYEAKFAAGGAIKVFGNNTIISNCNFTNNTALHGSGGALDMGGDNASVYYSWFDRNYAEYNGGAINWDGGHGSDSIIGSTFTNNKCNYDQQGGGAVFWTAGEIGHIGSGGLIQDSIFINNTALRKHGGAVNWYHAWDSVINNCLFINNTAASDGGALYTGHQTGGGFNLTMTNCQFYNNTANKHGGAIANQMEASWIYNNTFDGNKAQASGGTILLKETFAVNSVIDHCYIYNSYVNESYYGNRYGEGGGAIRIDDDNITITNCAIFNSVANSTYGGAIRVKSVNAKLINVTIQNAATLNDKGGAIYWDGDNGYMKNVTIFNSSSNSMGKKDANGGAIYLAGKNCNFTNITITSSSSNNPYNGSSNWANGGAIYVSGDSNVLSNITIDESTSSSGNFKSNGGAIYWIGNSGSLINASISNTLANGRGGAIYWTGGSPTIDGIFIEYSQTNVTNSANSADGGAMYLENIANLTNVYIVNALASRSTGDIKGGAIYYYNKNQGATAMNNITVIGSRASTGDGTSYGGAVYWTTSANTHNMYNSSFVENTADLGGAVYTVGTTNIWNTSFTGNVALDGGALYGTSGDDKLDNASFANNSAKRGGAIFVNNQQIKIFDSSLEFNTAEQEGGALYYNNVNMNNNRNTEITRTNFTNNTAFKGSAIYGTKFRNVYLQDVILLDNQANSKEFIEKAVGYDNETKKNYTSAVFVGFDNLLNAIWQDADVLISCDNVTYWDVGGRTVTSSSPTKSDREANINVTVEMYNGLGQRINVVNLTTDGAGRIYYPFDAEEDEDYYFAYIHPADRYYTYLRDTLANRSLVNLFVDDVIIYGQNQTFLIYLTDGAWGSLNGTVNLTFNDTKHTTVPIDVVNGSDGFVVKGLFGLLPGTYNVTASYEGDINHTGDSDWKVFTILPYTDLRIVKEANVTGTINVTDLIKFTITVFNDGPCNATNVNVSEYLDYHLSMVSNDPSHGLYDYGNSTWYIGDLANGTKATLTIVAQVIYSGNISNVVLVSCSEAESNYTNNRFAIQNITAEANVDLAIIKKVNVTGYVNVTDKIKFTITVTNKGPANATGVYVGESLSPHLQVLSNETTIGEWDGYTWKIGNLNKGEVHNLTITALVISPGVISNVVNITGDDNDVNESNNNDSIKNITSLPIVDLAITKSVNVSTVVNVSDLIKFTITVRNNGPCDATNVTVTEKLSDLLEVTQGGIEVSAGTYNVKSGLWTIEKLANQSTATLTIVAKVISNGTIANVVVVNSTENDTNKSNNKDNITNITALPVVDLAITKEVNVSTVVYFGDLIKFTITVTNNGPSNATDVNVTEKLSDLLEVVPGGIIVTTGNYNETNGYWYIGDLNAGNYEKLTITAKVVANGTIANVVTVTSHENDTNKSNNNDSIENITALPLVDLQITKTVNVNVTRMDVSDKLEFTITVHNNGPCNATGVNVSEVLSPCLVMLGNVPSIGYYNVTAGVWYIGDLANGSDATLKIVTQIVYSGNITNVVIVTSNEKDTNESNNRDNITNITAEAHVDRGIFKTVNVGEVVNVTDLIVFTVTAYNKGPCNATGVYVLEALDLVHLELVEWNATKGEYVNCYTWNIGNLDKDEGVTLTITARVIAPGNITNYVEIFGWDNDTNRDNDNDSIKQIKAETIVDVQITKEVNVTVVNITDKIKFTVTVFNNGPCNATGVFVEEPLDLIHLGADYYWNVTKGDFDGYTWNIGDLANQSSAVLTIIANVTQLGSISNFVVVNVTEKDTNISNNRANVTNITVLPLVDLKVNKVVNVTEVNVTDYIRYTITLVNSGPCEATDVNVTEHLSPFVKFVAAEYLYGNYDNSTNVWHIPIVYVNTPISLDIIVQAISNGTIENVVTVTSHENDTNKSDNNKSSDNVTALPIVDVKIIKVVNVTVVNVTDKIEYTITVTNDGPSNATGVVVTDELSDLLELVSFESSRAGITYDSESGIANIGKLDANETVILTIVARAISNGTIENMANVTSNENDTNKSNNENSSENVTALPIVDVKVNKTVSTTIAKLGDNLTYIITVYNNGPNDATNVNVTEYLSNKVTLIQHNASKGNYDTTKNIWYVGSLSNGTIATLKLTVKVNKIGIVENSVIVNSTEKDSNLTNNNYTSENVTVTKLDTPIELYTYNITYGEDEVLVVELPTNATGTVNITVGNRTYTDVPINNGTVELVVEDLAGGNYTVDVIYGGDDTYLPNSTSGIFNVARVTPIITIEVEDIWVWEIEVLNVTVNAPGTVNVTVYGITVKISLENGVETTYVLTASKKPDYKGNATWNIIQLPVGTYPAFAIYPGNENYTSVNITDVFHVRDLIPTNVVVVADDIYVGEDAIINVTVGPEGVTGNVTINVDGTNYTATLENGKTTLIVPGLPAGEKNVTVWYEGNLIYLPSENSTTFEVLKLKPPVDIVSPDITVGEDGVITVYVPDDATGTITIEIDGKRYTADIENGKAIFIIPGLKVGEYDIIAFYSGNDKYLPANNTGVMKVNPKESPDDHNKTHKKSTIENIMPATGNPILALIVVLMSLCLVQIRRFKK